MRTGVEIFEEYQNQRDCSGSKLDSYTQDLMTFWFHAQMQGKASDFYLLLEKAVQENKQISYEERDPEIMWDDYPVEGLILVKKEF